MGEFDPSRYLTKVSGSDYLEVKWRLVWLRDVHPDAVIDTELVEHNGQHAVVHARITLPSGAASSGYGSEGLDDFANYIEKAETKALGRALAALGFGTQFCPDFEYGAHAGHVVDSPVARQTTQPYKPVERVPRAPERANGPQKVLRPLSGISGRGDRPTERQLPLLHGLVIRKLPDGKMIGPDGGDHHNPAALRQWLTQHGVMVDPSNLSKMDVSTVIDHLQTLDDRPRNEPPADAEQTEIEPEVLAAVNSDLDRQQRAKRHDG